MKKACLKIKSLRLKRANFSRQIAGGMYLNSYGFIRDYKPPLRILDSKIEEVLLYTLKDAYENLKGRKHESIKLFWQLKVKNYDDNNHVKDTREVNINASGDKRTIEEFFLDEVLKARLQYKAKLWLIKSWSYYVTMTKTKRVKPKKKAAQKKAAKKRKVKNGKKKTSAKISNQKKRKAKKHKVRHVRRRGK